MKNGNNMYYKNPQTYLQYLINYFEDNRELVIGKKLKESDLKDLQETIKENLGEFHSLGELWSTCIYIKQWSK